jgi:dihydrofolate reductase
MGRKTWESFPRRPLPGRPNLVVTRDGDYDAPGAEVFASVDEAVARAEALARELQVDEVMVLGGAQIYEALIGRATRIYLTEVHASPEGDTRFAFDRTGWREVSRERHQAGEKDSSDYSFVVLERG